MFMVSPNTLSAPQQKTGFFLPSPDLAAYVKYYWKMIDPNLSELHKKSSISPSGYPELIFQFGDPVIIDFQNNAAGIAPLAMVAGQITQSISLGFSNSLHCFCVKLMPYALRAIFNFTSSEFTNQATDLGNVTPSVYPDLYCRLKYWHSDQYRITTIENYLRSLLKKNQGCISPISEHFVKQINLYPNLSFRTIMDSVALSQRTFERKIKHDIGLSAKKFHRIIRFNTAYSTIKNYPDMRLQDVVFQYGYYDQSHFVNEFKEFTGSSPLQYFKNEDNYNHFFAGIG
jgi:AraC-like DNA-binding protein